MTRIDIHAARRRFERAASTCSEASVLAREVERRMAERLDYIKHEPQRVLDAGQGVGDGLRVLRRRYPKAMLLGVDSALALARRAESRQTVLARAMAFAFAPRPHHLCADMVQLPLANTSVGMVWSNLALAWVEEPLAVLREIHRVLEMGGLIMFSTYGPDTLKELKRAFAEADAKPHIHPFIDMHDLGDMLLAAGFADPVMDMEYITLTYAGVDALARDLRNSGQTNVALERSRGLMGRRTWQAMERAYERFRRDGRLPATFEIVYGHAWKVQSHRQTDPGGRDVARIDFMPRRPR
ncbi:MAG: methyltransferase domain-containing protein [Betaproteobacteria bacterium]|nr:methyltransferase domain-containing protein [Betaproteobacteria bacterium]